MENSTTEHNFYKIGAIAKATGLSVHNLRVWEKRYRAISVSRTDSGRRLYSEADLKRLFLLKQCVDNGLAISSIAECENNKLEALLAEFGESGVASSAKQKSWRLSLVGADAYQLIQPVLMMKQFSLIAEQHPHLDALCADKTGTDTDILFLDCPSLTRAEARQIGQKLKALQLNKVILAYRYARQQDIAYLKTIGVHALKVPFDARYIKSLFEQLLQTHQTTRSLVPAGAPTRRFSDQQLNRAALMSSSIECECPQHMAEIIKSLTAFEAYSAQCENEDKSARDLHHHIYLKTAEARATMEALLQSVLDQEGINLDRL